MTVKDIEKAIKDLPKSELAELSAWFDKYEADIWDFQIEAEIDAGRFDDFRAEAIGEFESGQTQPL